MKDIIGRKLLMATLFTASITSFAGCYYYDRSRDYEHDRDYAYGDIGIVTSITGAIITREMIWKTGTLFGIIASAIGTMAKTRIVYRTRREK